MRLSFKDKKDSKDAFGKSGKEIFGTSENQFINIRDGGSERKDFKR